MPEFSLQQQPAFSRLYAGGVEAIFLYSAIGIFVLALTGTGGLVIFNRAENTALDELVVQNQLKEESLRPELLNQFVVLDKRLKGIRELLAAHAFASNVFRVIEANVHPEARFINFSFAAAGLRSDMSGEAASYRALAEQIAILEREPQIQKVEFGGLSSIGEGLVGFKLSLTFKPDLIRLRQ